LAAAEPTQLLEWPCAAVMVLPLLLLLVLLPLLLGAGHWPQPT